MNLLYGLHRPDAGTIRIAGVTVSIDGPKSARRLGIGMVFQNFALVSSFNATENVMLGTSLSVLRLNRAERRQRVAALCRDFGLEIDIDVPVRDLSAGGRQWVEILKLLDCDARVLILDEPTSVLTPSEVTAFFGVLRRLCEAGKTILLITHKLDEVMALADDITVMRGGRVAARRRRGDTDTRELAALMTDRFSAPTPRRPPGIRPGLVARRLTVRDARGHDAVRDANLAIHQGEMVGLAGVDGNGQEELADTLTGLRQPSSGSIFLNGREVGTRSPGRHHGVGYVSSDRRGKGLAIEESVALNLALRDLRAFRAGGILGQLGWLDLTKIHAHARAVLDEFGIQARNGDQPVRELSGGNQQKVLLACEIPIATDLLVASQPCQGLDVGAVSFVHETLSAVRARGSAILYISNETEHLLATCDRLAVTSRGRIVRSDIAPEAVTQERLGLWLAGLDGDAS